MIAPRRLRPVALLLHYEQISLIDAEHGLVLEEAPLALQTPKGWEFGPAAINKSGSLHFFASRHFPLADYFEWFLSRFFPLRKLRLFVLTPEPLQPLSISLWAHLFSQLGLRESVQLHSPLYPLASSLKQGLLVYLADGLSQVAVCRKGQIQELSQAGYGFYLTRAVRQHVLERYSLKIDVPTAEQAWLRLGGSEHQLTIEGRDQHASLRRQLLIAEELRSAFNKAFEPLLRELDYLKQLNPELSAQVYGPHAPWLASQAAGLQQSLALPPDRDRILIHSIQQYLKGQL